MAKKPMFFEGSLGLPYIDIPTNSQLKIIFLADSLQPSQQHNPLTYLTNYYESSPASILIHPNLGDLNLLADIINSQWQHPVGTNLVANLIKSKISQLNTQYGGFVLASSL